MQLSLTPSVSQIRWYIESALNGFETLSLETAASEAQSELRALLRYLDALDSTNDAVAVLISGGVKPIIKLEGCVSDSEGRD